MQGVGLVMFFYNIDHTAKENEEELKARATPRCTESAARARAPSAR